MRRKTQHGADSLLVHVEDARLPIRRARVDATLPEPQLEIGRIPARYLDGYDGALLSPAIEHPHAGNFRELRAQQGGQSAGALAAAGADSERIARRRPQACNERIGELPVFEPARAVGEPKGVRIRPVRTAHVEEEGERATLEHSVGHIEESDAARTAQELAPRACQEIA